MWEFPHGPVSQKETTRTAAVRIVEELTGLEVELGEELPAVKHGITRYRITMTCFEATFRGGRFRSAFYRRGRWIKPDELADFPVSVPQRELARALV